MGYRLSLLSHILGEVLHDPVDVLAHTKRCIEENSTTAQSQDTYLEKYNALVARYETAKAKLEKLQAEKAQREAKAEDIGGFMFELAEYGESLTEFDDRLWLTLIDTVTVHRDGQLTFKFQTGHEMLELRINFIKKGGGRFPSPLLLWNVFHPPL